MKIAIPFGAIALAVFATWFVAAGPLSSSTSLPTTGEVLSTHRGEISAINLDGNDVCVQLKDGTRILASAETDGIYEAAIKVGMTSAELQKISIGLMPHGSNLRELCR